MDNQNSTVVFLKSRSFAGKISASFKFINENFKVLFKFGSYILLPVSIILAVLSLIWAHFASEPASVGYIVSAIITVIFSFIGGSVFYAFLFTCIKEYKQNGYIGNITLFKIKSLLIANFRKVLLTLVVVTIFMALLMALTVVLAIISLYTLILMIPILLFLYVPLIYLCYLFVLEDISFGKAVKEAFKIGVPTWSSAFGVLLISGLLAGLMQVIASAPWLLGIAADSFAQLAMLNGEPSSLPGYFNIMMFVFGAMAIFLSAFAEILVIVSMAFQYYGEKARQTERMTEMN